MSSLHFYQLVKLSDAGWINRSKTPWIVNRRSVSRGDRRNYNSASPWCSWIGRWLTGRFLIKADPDIRIMAHNTYVWIGFYEESAGQPSTNPATPGTGRIVISTIASADGTTVYNPRNLAAIDPTRVTQLNKLVKVEGTHLATFPDGSGTGDTFDSRPAAIYETAKIGDTTPPNPSLTPFQYPVGNPAPAAQ